MTSPLATEPLNETHDRNAFRSGSDALDRYFREQVSQDIRRRVAGCFVAVDSAGRVSGYYTLAASSVTLDALPESMTKRLPRYPVVPVVLIGRLAVAENQQGRGLGSALIADAVLRIDQLKIGAFAVIVDAKDDSARSFYEANGFIALPGAPRRLCLPMQTAMQGVQR